MDKHVLILSEDWFFAELIARRCLDKDWQVEVSANCDLSDEGLTTISRPDIVVLDDTTGDTVGWELLDIIKRLSRTYQTQFIVLTNLDAVPHPKIRRILSKPTTVERVLAALTA